MAPPCYLRNAPTPSEEFYIMVKVLGVTVVAHPSVSLYRALVCRFAGVVLGNRPGTSSGQCLELSSHLRVDFFYFWMRTRIECPSGPLHGCRVLLWLLCWLIWVLLPRWGTPPYVHMTRQT